jgi:hypothetical protein
VVAKLLDGTTLTPINIPAAIAGLMNENKEYAGAIVKTRIIRSKLNEVSKILSCLVLSFGFESLYLILFNGTIDPL